MGQTALHGSPIQVAGELPVLGQTAPDFTLVDTGLAPKALAGFSGKKVLNIFPSIDTPVCAMSVRAFNAQAGARDGVMVLNISADLPFAHSRFCGAEGLDGVQSFSTFRGSFAQDYGVLMADGPLVGLCARAVLVLDENNAVIHRELVPEIAQEPDYAAALAALD